MQKSKIKILIPLLIVLDQAAKVLALRFLQITINPNIAFDIPLSNKFMLFATPALLFIFIFLAKKYFDFKKNLNLLAFALIMSGGISNYIDRLLRGGVIDFIDLEFWPAFNLADMYLTIGVFYLIIFHDRIIKNKIYG